MVSDIIINGASFSELQCRKGKFIRKLEISEGPIFCQVFFVVLHSCFHLHVGFKGGSWYPIKGIYQ